MSDEIKPQGIIVDLDRRLIQIKWSDSLESLFDLDTLRRACPCAECRPWIHEAFRSSAPHEPAESVTKAVGELRSMQDIQPVGSYGIQFNWADGHVFGIYDWKYLRSLGVQPA
jgi:DUF971 family protein